MSTVIHTCQAPLERTYGPQNSQPLVRDHTCSWQTVCPQCSVRVVDADLEELTPSHWCRECAHPLYRHVGKVDGVEEGFAIDCVSGAVLDDGRCPCGWEIQWAVALTEAPGDHFPLMPSLMDTLGAALKESIR